MSNVWRFDLDKVASKLRSKLEKEPYRTYNIQYASVMRNARFAIWDGKSPTVRIHLSSNDLKTFTTEEEIAEYIYNLYALELL